MSIRYRIPSIATLQTQTAGGISGSSSITINLTGSASGTVGISGSSSVTVQLTGSASAQVGLAGSSSRTIDTTGSATGTVGLSGSSNVELSLTGSASGTVGISGASSKTIDLIGVSQAAVGLSGSSDVTINMTGSASGEVAPEGISGSSSITIPITGSATGTIGLSGSSSVVLTMIANSTAMVELKGQSDVTFEMTGSATASTIAGSISGSSDVTIYLSGSASAILPQDTLPRIAESNLVFNLYGYANAIIVRDIPTVTPVKKIHQDLISKGMAWFEKQRRKHLAREIVYTRKGVEYRLTATTARTIFETIGPTGVPEHVTLMDFIISKEELSEVNFPPKKGDRISYNDETYEVMAIPGQGEYQYTDADRRAVRIHTKQVGVFR